MAVSNATLRFGSMVYDARPTIDRVRPRSGANVERRARVGHDFAGVAADKHPFAGLPLELHDVEHVLVASPARRRREVRRLAFDREPARRHRDVGAVRSNRRDTAAAIARRSRRRADLARDVDIRQVVEAVEERQRVLVAARRCGPSARPSAIRSGSTAAGIDERHGCARRRHGGPALIEQRHAARREARHPHRLERLAAALHRRARTPVTARNSVSTTLRKSRGAKRSVGVTMSVLPQRMNCLPTSTVSGRA